MSSYWLVVDVGAFDGHFVLELEPGPGVCVRSCIPTGGIVLPFFFRNSA